MRLTASVALIALLSAPAFCGDLVITKSKHEDAVKSIGGERPASDSTEVTWFAKDRMRIEDGDRITIVRGDQKKMYLLDKKEKTVSTVDLPFDMKKYLPPEAAPYMEQIMGQIKVMVTPTTETKKIKDWNATKYTMSMTMGMGGSVTQDVWVTKDIELDRAAYNEMSGALMATIPGGQAVASEYKKLDGMAVLVESTHKSMGGAAKSREEVTAVETKDAPEGNYEVPKGYTEKPFDPMADSPMGGAGGGKPKGPPPGQKPKEKG